MTLWSDLFIGLSDLSFSQPWWCVFQYYTFRVSYSFAYSLLSSFQTFCFSPSFYVSSLIHIFTVMSCEISLPTREISGPHAHTSSLDSVWLFIWISSDVVWLLKSRPLGQGRRFVPTYVYQKHFPFGFILILKQWDQHIALLSMLVSLNI